MAHQKLFDFLNEHCNFVASETDMRDIINIVHEETNQHPDTEADGYIFCGKCGKLK